jgi:PDDEXK-like domain of unknown function (DUF3799)
MREPGIYDLTEAEYLADPALSASGAKLLLKAPAKFLEARLHPVKPKKVYDFGHLAHLKLLGIGPEIVPLDPNVHGLKKDGTLADSPKATAAWQKAEAEARARGAIPVSIEEVEKANLMAAAVRDHPLAGQLFVEGRPEVSLFATDPKSGQLLRGRLDWLIMSSPWRTFSTRTVIVEYKTAEDASKDSWKWNSYKYGYHISAAWYLELLALLDIDTEAEILHVVQEKTPPYLVAVYDMNCDLLLEGRKRMREAINIWLDCKSTDVWPGYPSEIQTVGLPWARSIEEEA